jgi:hypothetical protein
MEPQTNLAQRLGSPLPNEMVWFSHIVVPVVFFFVSGLYVWDGVELTWTFLAALWSMCLPFILVLLHCYVKRFKLPGGMEGEMTSLPASDVGSDGRGVTMILANERQADQPEDETTGPTAHFQTDTESPPETDDYDFESSSPQARKVLRTLWTFQRMTFGPNDAQRRWGFGINPAAPDYAFFAAGSAELVMRGLVARNEKAMVFLNNEGMDFCRRHEAWLLSGGDVWSKFAPA